MEIFCTLGPKTLNKSFLKYIKGKITLVRLNLSHINLVQLKRHINFISKNSSIPICIDTEGAQIRTKVKKRKKFIANEKGEIKKSGNFTIYPPSVFEKLKKNDLLDVGFDNLKIKILKTGKSGILFTTIRNGFLENNKGIHLINRKINLEFLTEKDKKSILLAKKMNVKNFALSFTNSSKEIKKFENLIPRSNKIYKIETKRALRNLNSILKMGNNFLLDRGDLSKEIGIEQTPVAQREIFKSLKKFKRKKIYIATNYLESMIKNAYPTRAEANDIYSAFEMGASGVVLSAETAIGKYPKECVDFCCKMIKIFNLKNNLNRI